MLVLFGHSGRRPLSSLQVRQARRHGNRARPALPPSVLAAAVHVRENPRGCLEEEMDTQQHCADEDDLHGVQADTAYLRMVWSGVCLRRLPNMGCSSLQSAASGHAQTTGHVQGFTTPDRNHGDQSPSGSVVCPTSIR